MVYTTFILERFRKILEGNGFDARGETGETIMWRSAKRKNNRRIMHQKSIQH